MSESFMQSLAVINQGRTAFIGIGNADLGDDGAGELLASRLKEAGVSDVFHAGTAPEHYALQVAGNGFTNIILCDAVDAAQEPGAVVWMNAQQIASRFPQVSTHKFSLGTVARLCADGGASVWLLGIQPASLRSGAVSDAVEKTVDLCALSITEVMKAGMK